MEWEKEIAIGNKEDAYNLRNLACVLAHKM